MRLVVRIAAEAAWRSTPTGPGLDLRGQVAPGPDGGVRLDGGHIGQPEGAHTRSERRVGAVARVHEDDPAGDLRLEGLPDLVERDLRLGLKDDALGHAGLLAARRIGGPVLRQIEPIGDRQAGRVVSDRQVTATWQLSCLPSWPEYWRVTPTECRPFLGKPVSPMIQASTGPLRSSAGRASSRTLASTASSDQAD